MNRTTLLSGIALLATAASAHVVLPPEPATAGTAYTAAFKVGHPCKGASTTTALSVRLPDGFALVRAQPREGWRLQVDAHQVTWTAIDAASAQGHAPTTFAIEGRLPDTPGTLWFPTLQTCDVGSADWAVVSGPGDAKPEYPAPHVDVLARDAAAAASAHRVD